MATLMEDVERLGRTANRIADERNALLKLVRRALLNPRDYVEWRDWIEEAAALVESFLTAAKEVR